MAKIREHLMVVPIQETTGIKIRTKISWFQVNSSLSQMQERWLKNDFKKHFCIKSLGASFQNYFLKDLWMGWTL